MLYTNINIANNSNQFKYVLEYIPSNNTFSNNTKYVNGIDIQCENNEDEWERKDYVLFLHNYIENTPQYIKHHNHWHDIYVNKKIWVYKYDENGEYGEFEEVKNRLVDSYMPINCAVGVVRLYFPQFSMDSFHCGHSYALTISTWICGREIILGSHIINRYDALACPNVKTFFNEEYLEYVELPIIDPNSLIYSDDWKEWRQKICDESLNIDTINSVGSVLQCTLHPILSVNDEYMKTLEDYVGGQNFISLTTNKNDFLNLDISTNTNRSLGLNERPAIEFNLNFNKFYDGSLKEYLDETYGVRDYKIKYELVVGNNDDIYAVCTSPELDLTTSYKFTKDEITKNNFENGDGWVHGINIKGSVNILDEDNESFLYILSNEIPFTKDIFKYFVKTDFIDKYDRVINNINLDLVNMDIININAVNKIENQIIKIERSGDNKSNILQTTFYRVTDSSSIVVRPEINENICINLDPYKHLVDSFMIQIEGVKFIEIGRIKSGVVFKIIGNKLPKKIFSGQYYILNQDADYITGGKYIYEV